MIDLVFQWLQERLGQCYSSDIDEFINSSRDGRLIAEILRNYDIISDNQLLMIERSEDTQKCLDNFNNFLRHWLSLIGLEMTDVNVMEFVNGSPQEVTQMFYRLYLQLKDTSVLHYIVAEKSNQKLRPPSKRFIVEEVTGKAKINEETICSPFIDAHDVIHWHKDRMNMLLRKYKEQRQDYMDFLLVRQRAHPITRSTFQSKRQPELKELDYHFDEPVEVSYETLVEEKERMQTLPKFHPNPQESKIILQKFKDHKRIQMEKNIEKSQLQKELFSQLWNQFDKDRCFFFDKYIAEKLLTQSLFEKQMVNKLAEVKLQKEIMVENKKRMNEAISKQKDNEFMKQLLIHDQNLQQQKISYYLERERILELHKRLYKQKQELAQQRKVESCESCLSGILNLTKKELEYKAKYGREPDQRIKQKWKSLFLKSQLLSDDEVQEMCQDISIAEENEAKKIGSEEEIKKGKLEVSHEEECKECICEQELDNYLKYNWPYNMTENNPMPEEMEAALNILGFIVHKILLLKYPIPKFGEVPVFPEVKTAVCINGLTNLQILPILKKLLEPREIVVIELEDAMKFCLDSFKLESQTEYDDTLLSDESVVAVQQSKPKKKPLKGKKKSIAIDSLPPTDDLELNSKMSQTPIKFPCEEIVLSRAAQLGEYVADQLNLGQSINDYTLISMFVEYLKSFPKLRGWVLINYPSTYEQAVILDEALTGKSRQEIINKCATFKRLSDYVDVEERYIDDIFDPNEMRRLSKLVPNTLQQLKSNSDGKTYLTAYIKIRNHEDLNSEDVIPVTLPPPLRDLEANADPLEKYYSQQGCNYSFYYEMFDFTTVKYLTKLIIGGYSLPLKSSKELFGDGFDNLEYGNEIHKNIYNLGFFKIVDKKEQRSSRLKSTSLPEELKPKSISLSEEPIVNEEEPDNRKASIVIIFENKAVQIPEVEEEEVMEEQEPTSSVYSLEPGCPGWKYVDLLLPAVAAEIWAIFWETIEDVYIENFKELFYLKHTILDEIVPYVQSVKNRLSVFVRRPSKLQYYLREFQRLYNEFDADWRDDDEFKAELHCRIQELSRNLIEVSDQRMMDSENERQRLINDNFVPKLICELSNLCIDAVELEIDRFVDTMQLVNDYFMTLKSNLSYTDEIPRIELGKIELEMVLTDKSINTFLINTEGEIPRTIIHRKLKDEIDKALDFVNKTKLMMPGLKVVNKETVPSKASEKKRKTPVVEDVTLFANREKLGKEWERVTEGEVARTSFQLNLLRNEMINCIEDALRNCQKDYKEIYMMIKERYNNELHSIDDACRVLRRAVEEEIPIQEEFVFVGDKFFIDPDNLLYEDPVVMPEPPKVYPRNDFNSFSLYQLNKIADIFFHFAPNGFILERTFIYILQDFVAQDEEDGFGSLVPKFWKQLQPHQVNQLALKLFDQNEYFSWKDFILVNLPIEFPTEEELMEIRQKFRIDDPDANEIVMDYQFFAIKFWFEDDLNDAFLSKGIKTLLCRLYKVKSDTVNYSAMLLDFCKDANPVVGFAKVIELCLGKMICWDETLGFYYVHTLMQRRKQDEERQHQWDIDRMEHIEHVQEILEGLMDKTVHQYDSVLTEDLDSESSPFSDQTTKSAPTEVNLHEDIYSYLHRNSPSRSENEFENMNIIVDNLFSNVEIGFEEAFDPALSYLLPFQVLLTAVTAALPWHSKVLITEDQSFCDIMEEVYENCRNPNFNNSVLSHEFLNNEQFKSLIMRINRFKRWNIVELILELTANNKTESVQ